MTKPDCGDLSADAWDEMNDPRPAESDFDRVVDAALSRRGFLSGLVAFGSGASVMGGLPGRGRAQGSSRFAFTPIASATDHTVQVPQGYTWDILVRWGDPLFPDAPALDQATGGDAGSALRVFGEATDGMESFVVDGRQLIAVNHEFANRRVNLPDASGGIPRDAADVRKLQKLQGVTVMEIAADSGRWQVVQGSPFTRRITHLTPVAFSGPAAGHDLLMTRADQTGRAGWGTFNNCGAGKTPWGTYLTCEENFNGYFGATGPNADVPAIVREGYKRYGIGATGWGYDYHKWDARFDISTSPNEPHRCGWVVEVDPSDPGSTPVKHTGLGRFKHENAEVVLASDGRVVVYMGDDERGEFLYRFVSDRIYMPGQPTEGLLDEGTLFVATFSEDGTGHWLPLTPESTGMANLAEVLMFARMAGSAVGATTMDRPEWVAVNPHKPEAYCCLTNNKHRGRKANAGGDDMTVNGPNPRETNKYGQIVRWRPEGGDHAADGFEWDLYVMAGNPEVYDNNYGGSDNITSGNMFHSPDGMAFDSTGLVWIQTDGDDSNTGEFAGMGNNQMLVGDPDTGEIARFLTGPKGCEVTGLCWSADRRSMFVGIQHPDAPFPDGEGLLPRSSIIVVRRLDGDTIG